MTDVPDTLKKAEELGKAVAESDRFKALESARKDVEDDKDLQADMNALETLARKLAQLEHESKPIEPDDKRRLRDLQTKIAGNHRMRHLARVEADFAELMNRINRAIQTQLRGV